MSLAQLKAPASGSCRHTVPVAAGGSRLDAEHPPGGESMGRSPCPHGAQRLMSTVHSMQGRQCWGSRSRPQRGFGHLEGVSRGRAHTEAGRRRGGRGSGEEQPWQRDEPVQRPWGRRAGAARGGAKAQKRTGSQVGARGVGQGPGPACIQAPTLCETRSVSVMCCDFTAEGSLLAGTKQGDQLGGCW